MTIIIDGTTGVPVSPVTGTLAVLNGGTGVTTKTGTGAVVLGTSPTITGATITVASTAAPAFSAYLGSSQTISNATWTKVVANTELFDTNSNYDSTTNYRFTPTVAGYYQLNICWVVNAVATAIQLALYKNGASNVILAQTANSTATVSGSALVYSNGSTDYWEFYVNLAVGEARPSTTGTFFSGSMVRSA